MPDHVFRGWAGGLRTAEHMMLSGWASTLLNAKIFDRVASLRTARISTLLSTNERCWTRDGGEIAATR